jgi:hypothetical protein
MVKGLGRIQLGCLHAIEKYEAEGRLATTFNIAAEIYAVGRDRNGNLWVNTRQRIATLRALENLRRKGLISGEQKVEIGADGKKLFTLAKSRTDGRADRSCFWSMIPPAKPRHGGGEDDAGATLARGSGAAFAGAGFGTRRAE